MRRQKIWSEQGLAACCCPKTTQLCVCVCVCVCARAHMYICSFICVHTMASKYMYVHEHVCACTQQEYEQILDSTSFYQVGICLLREM